MVEFGSPILLNNLLIFGTSFVDSIVMHDYYLYPHIHTKLHHAFVFHF